MTARWEKGSFSPINEPFETDNTRGRSGGFPFNLERFRLLWNWGIKERKNTAHRVQPELNLPSLGEPKQEDSG